MASCNTNKKETTSCNITDEGCKTSNAKEHLGEYWCSMYTDVDITKLGWYEKEATPSLALIKNTKLAKDAKQFHAGAGSTTLIDSLVDEGYTNLIVNDISSCALNKIKHRIRDEQVAVEWVVDDLVNPTKLENMSKVDLWNDRAVLHFFTEEKDQDAYFKLLNEKVKNNGFVILSVFNLNGATKCSGLAV
ncbi:methyltransferase domain-containing protein, partial [Lutibacter sp.]|uniref:class I SAM-dependent methyltransferase n=1 Tax=Lutibacter sp. TaxID=1925666 RepID=UPI0025BD1FB7